MAKKKTNTKKKTSKKKKAKKKSAVMAKWGSMKWVFKSDKILPIENDLSITYSINDKNKKEKIPVSFSYIPSAITGANVNKELNRWKKLIGKSHPLYIGKKRFGPAKLKLKSVEESDISVYARGVKVSASISLSFIENKKKSSKTSKKKTNSKVAAAKKTSTKKAKSK